MPEWVKVTGALVALGMLVFVTTELEAFGRPVLAALHIASVVVLVWSLQTARR